ncbi:MAG: GntR family transcriptional regulator [Dorea sp.]|jgi:DNA-binding GntR family transcriptional regulator|nr:GntR family transcriptional regulator [Dorea sp.]
MEQSCVAKSQPLHKQVYEYLRGQIIYGKIVNGEKLIESKIAKELNVSRSPVREALRMLCADELLVDKGDGLVVNPMDYQTSIEVYESRIALEPFAARLAAERIDDVILAQMKDCVDSVENCRGKVIAENYALIIEANTKFHALISQACRHHFIQKYLDNNQALMALVRNNEFYQTIHEEDFIDEHAEIYEALAEHDAERAEQAMRKHVTTDYEAFQRDNKESRRD